jgi:hypothetical protein
VFALLAGLCAAFQLPVTTNLRLITLSSVAKRSSVLSPSRFGFCPTRQSRLGLRAEVTPTPQKDEELSSNALELNSVEAAVAESPSVLSDDELEARIAAVGLDRVDTTIKEDENLTPIEQAMKKSATIGKTAIATAASSAISVLNKLEKVPSHSLPCFISICRCYIFTCTRALQPIDEEEWKTIARTFQACYFLFLPYCTNMSFSTSQGS